MAQKTPTTLKEHIVPYRDKYGLVHPHKCNPDTLLPTTKNGLHYLGFYICLLKALKLGVGENEQNQLMNAVNSCRVNKTGLLSRIPNDSDQNAWDDYFGVMCAAVVSQFKAVSDLIINELSIKRRVKLDLGLFKLNLPIPFLSWYMNNERPGTFKHPGGRYNKSAYVGRSVALRFVVSLAKDASVCWLLRKLVCVVLKGGKDKPITDQGGWRTHWMMYQAYKASGAEYDDLNEAFAQLSLSLKDKGVTFTDTQVGYFDKEHPFMMDKVGF